MNTVNLSAGLVISNYKSLCNIVGENVKTGKSKILQLKDFERYFSYERNGNKYIIKEVYEMPKDKTDNRINGNHNKYCKYIEPILLKYLSRCKDDTNTFTVLQWCKLIGLVNDNYGEYYNSNMSQYGIDESDIMSFYSRVGRITRRILIDALHSLSNRKIIKFSEQTVIAYEQNGKICRDVANDYEEKEILDAEYTILHNDFKVDNVFQIYYSGKQKDYYRAVEKFLYDEYGYLYYYKQIKITSIRKDFLLSEIERYNNVLDKENLVNNLIEYINKNAKNLYNKSIGTRWELSKDYLEKQFYLTNKYISPIRRKNALSPPVKLILDNEYEFKDLLPF